MNRSDITASWRRSWCERHPMLSEALAIFALWCAITAIGLWILW
jgi:hypothetical protein